MIHTMKSRRCVSSLFVSVLTLALAACSTDDGMPTDEGTGAATVNPVGSVGPGGSGSVMTPGTAGPASIPSAGATGSMGSGPNGPAVSIPANGSGTADTTGGETAQEGQEGNGGTDIAGNGGDGGRGGLGGSPPGASGEGGSTSDASGEGGSTSEPNGEGGSTSEPNGEGGSTPGMDGEGGTASEPSGEGGAASEPSGGAGSDESMRESAGCGRAPTLTSGERTIQAGGQNRSYILRIPDNYDNSSPHRLVFAYHWRGGTMQDVDGGGTSGAAWSYYGLREQAGDSTIFVAPQGIGNGWPNSGGEDLAFTDEMLALIKDDLCVDTRRIFALGFSYGGGMSYALACARPDVFRAVAVYSGGVLSGCEGGNEPVAYMGIHGLSDSTLNISGGRSMRDRFVANNDCTPQDPPEPSPGSLTYTCTAYQGCAEGYPVEWCAFDGGHTPGMVDGGGDDGARTWTKAEVWRFFTQFD